MLLNDLYMLENRSTLVVTTTPGAATVLRVALVLNAAHPIFAGHFPGQPVVPGACHLQIVEELLSHFFQTEYRLTGAGKIKFLTPIDPRRNPRIEAVLRYAGQTAKAAGSGPVSGESAQPGPVSGYTRSVVAPAELEVTATLSADNSTFLKLNGIFRAG